MTQDATPTPPRGPNDTPRGDAPADERADAVAYQLLVPLLLIALLNGMHSPFTALLVKFAGGWYPPFLPAEPALVLYLAQLMVSTLTLMLAGIPAAVVEHVAARAQADGRRRTTFASMGAWLLGTALLTLPALGVMRQLLQAQ